MASVPQLTLNLLPGVAEIPASAWNALVDEDDPFLEHAFLAALEHSGSVGVGTGWEPRILVAYQDKQLAGAVPLYLKRNSWGEFIWDFAWAEGSLRAGIPYYPKLVAGIPFTPVAGRRFLVHPDLDRAEVLPALAAGLLQTADETKAWSVHVLFCRADEVAALEQAGFTSRASHQLHWHNRTTVPYADFGDFLADFRASHRKQVRHERAVAASYGLDIRVALGSELDDQAWAALDRFYRETNDQYGNVAFLNPPFFAEIHRTHANRVLAVLAYREEKPIASSLSFLRGSRLCGRYWGSAEALPMLHFELCFYRLIEYAIAHGLTIVEGGAGGDHKLARGLLPRRTYSAHWLRHPGLARAVGEFVAEEARDVQAEMDLLWGKSPFAQGKAAP